MDRGRLVHLVNWGEHPVEGGKVEDAKRSQSRKVALREIFERSKVNHMLVDSSKRPLEQSRDHKHVLACGGTFLPVEESHGHSLTR